MKKEASSEPNTMRSLLIAFILLFFALSWWPISISVFRKFYQPMETLNPPAIIIARAQYYISIAVSSIIGSVISKRVRKLSFLYYWMIVGVISSWVPIFFVSTNEWHLFTVSILLGFAFGVGMPSCLAFFAELTRLENRGSLGGAIFLVSNLTTAILAIALLDAELTFVASIAAIWRVIGLVLFILLKPKERAKDESYYQVSLISVFRNKQFLLYFIPWFAFSLIEWFEYPLRTNLFGEDFARSAEIMGVSIGSISAVIGGVLSDRIGRKIVVLYGFVSIGIAYAALSIAPSNVLTWYFYTIIDAIAWGLFYTMFTITLWGDLSQSLEKEKYYAIGNIPFFIAGTMELVARPYVTLIRPEASFSLAAFFLFLAILPLLYAPETLPEKKIRERELRRYIEKAKKIKGKHA